MDNRLLLSIILTVILIVGYYVCGKKLSAPVVIFTVPFIFQALESFLYYPWDITTNTVIIISVGCLTFTSACAMVHVMFPARASSENGDTIVVPNKPMLSTSQYLALIFIVLVSILLIYRGVAGEVGGKASSFTDIISQFNEGAKSKNSGIRMGQIESLLYNALCGGAFAFAYLFAAATEYPSKKRWILPAILFFIGSCGVVVSGSRTDVVGPFLAFVVLVLMFRERGNNTISIDNIAARYIAYIIIAVIAVLVIFYCSIFFLGRDVQQNSMDYISTYVGAPLQNLDYSIQQGLPGSDYFGNHTFRNLYPSLEKLGIVPPDAEITRFPFLSRHSYFTGNVYTLFYALVIDFGIWGTLIAICIMGIIMQIIYEIAIRAINQQIITLSPVLYALLSFYLFMSFFSSNFYQNLVSTGFIKALVGIICIIVYQRICHALLMKHVAARQAA